MGDTPNFSSVDADADGPQAVAKPSPNASVESFTSAWRWVPSLYFAEAIPYVLVMTVSVVFYKDMGMSNTDLALYTSLLYLPWVIKPLWSPLVDVLWTKRLWILAMQIVIAAGVGGIALFATSSYYVMTTLAFFWLLAFASATHDIAADGFYMIGMDQHKQAFFVGIRSSFYRLGMIACSGLLVMLAGALAEAGRTTAAAWATAFYVAAAAFLVLAFYHSWALPRREANRLDLSAEKFAADVADTVVSFFRKPGVGIGVAYILLYRFAEGQLGKIAQPFLLDPIEKGGLGLTVKDTGFIYGTAGVLMLVLGGIIGGLAVARHGLGTWILWMAAAINLPNLVYVLLSFAMPTQTWVVTLGVAVEQFGYGFGFAGYMLYMLYLAQGEHQTAHYALCTGIMALGMMLPGMISGAIQEWLGYQWFFVWVMAATIPSFVVTWLVPIDPNFGRADETQDE